MTIIIEPYTIPEKGTVELKIERSFDIKVTSEEARRQVNRWLLNEVSYLIGADSPTLVIGERVVWRVPAWLSPHWPGGDCGYGGCRCQHRGDEQHPGMQSRN
jgi:hypothetical protein